VQTLTTLRNKLILVVDDDADTRDLLQVVLQQAGAEVIPAESVDAAVKLFRCSPPHAIVSDIRLRSSDGFELMKAIREQNKEYRGYTPAVAVTGFSSPGDEERALAAGFNAYIVKPFDPDEMVKTITHLLHDQTETAA
jgi:CheY-like chemotaxis protein